MHNPLTSAEFIKEEFKAVTFQETAEIRKQGTLAENQHKEEHKFIFPQQGAKRSNMPALHTNVHEDRENQRELNLGTFNINHLAENPKPK